MLSFSTVVNQSIPQIDNHYLKVHPPSDSYVPTIQKNQQQQQLMSEWIRNSGFASCTETLGFESSDERSCCSSDEFSTSGEEENEIYFQDATAPSELNTSAITRRFPPPLPSLNRLGEPSFIVLPVRRNGRLELTEIKVKRPELLCATRHNGRLTLHLVKDQDNKDDDDDYDQAEEEKEGNNEEQQDKEGNNEEQQDQDDERLQADPRHHHRCHGHDYEPAGLGLDEVDVLGWSSSSLVPAGEGVKRCYEDQLINMSADHRCYEDQLINMPADHRCYKDQLINMSADHRCYEDQLINMAADHRHHQHLQLWRQHCVTTGRD